MSKQRTETIVCPECGGNIEVRIWDSVNTMLDPETAKSLLSGDLFLGKCSCGAETHIDYPMVWHGMQYDAMVGYAPTKVQSEGFVAGIRSIRHAAFRNYRYRLVTNQNALKEKAIIFSSELDDRIMEILKYLMIRRNRAYSDPSKTKQILFNGRSGDNYVFCILGEENKSVAIHMEVYKNLHAKYAEGLSNLPAGEFVIDENWAKQFVEGSEK